MTTAHDKATLLREEVGRITEQSALVREHFPTLGWTLDAAPLTIRGVEREVFEEMFSPDDRREPSGHGDFGRRGSFRSDGVTVTVVERPCERCAHGTCSAHQPEAK